MPIPRISPTTWCARSALRCVPSRAAGLPGGCGAEIRTGFALDRAASEAAIDLTRLIAGAEGTLCLVTEAPSTLRTVPVPPAHGVLLLPFGRLVDAAAAVTACVASSPTSCDLFDCVISLLRDALPAFRDWFAEPAEAVLMIEVDDEIWLR